MEQTAGAIEMPVLMRQRTTLLRKRTSKVFGEDTDRKNKTLVKSLSR